jgi:hypothetical protein
MVRVAEAIAVEGFRLRVVFTDGEEREIAVGPVGHRPGPDHTDNAAEHPR